MRRLLALLLIVACCAAGWRSAGDPYRFEFPRDYGSHPAYRTEWWYFTGHLLAADGHRYGFELTIFRVGLEPGAPTPEPGESRWRDGEIFSAHFALTDDTDGTFAYSERVVRPALGQAGAARDGLDVHALGWYARGDDPIRLHAATRKRAVTLSLFSRKPPAINGVDGISWKGSCSSCASHYYSLTRLVGVGTLRVGTRTRRVRALAWMDHEFGSGELQPDVVGWDWFALQLQDGREVMLYHLRRRNGTFIPASSGSLVERDGAVRFLGHDAFTIKATGTWRSPHTGAVYPSGWIVRVPMARLAVRVIPRVRDQELAGNGVSYWEGDVCVRAIDTTGGCAPGREHLAGDCPPDGATEDPAGRPACDVGEGYVELTGYAGEIPR